MDISCSADAFFAVFQIGGLVLFLGLFLGHTLRLTSRRHIKPITLSLGKRGLLGLVELGFFVEVNLWAMLVLLYVLPVDMQPLLGTPYPLLRVGTPYPLFGVGTPYPLLRDWLSGPRLIHSFPTRVAGAGLVVVAFVIVILALRALGDSWRLGLDESNPGELVTHGIYARSRNPIYAFFDLYFVGTFLINGRVAFLLLALLTIANLHYQILQEEQFLARVHGSAYECYRASTPRYFTCSRPVRTLARSKSLRCTEK